MIACIGGHGALVDLLLESSADLNVKSEVSVHTCALISLAERGLH